MADSALAGAARAKTLHSAANASTCCWDRLCLNNLLNAQQQEAAQSSGFLDLTVHRLDDGLALGIDR